MDIKCPKCGQDYEVGPEYAGKSVECQCGEKMTIPEQNNYSWNVEIFRRGFVRNQSALFSFNFDSGVVSLSGTDDEFYSKHFKIPSTTSLQKFNTGFFGDYRISQIKVSQKGKSVEFEDFILMLFSETLKRGGVVEINGGKQKGDFFRLFSDSISIHHRGFFNFFLEMGIQGEKQCLFDNITAIQIKPNGFTCGYIQISIKGEVASKHGIFSAIGDENSVIFYGQYGHCMARAARKIIFDWQRNHR